MNKRSIFFILLLALVLFISSCATQSSEVMSNPPGFFNGLLHGFILLFSFIGSLFTDYEIYAFPNAGAWYNFGFVLGVMFFFGGGGAGACKKR